MITCKHCNTTADTVRGDFTERAFYDISLTSGDYRDRDVDGSETNGYFCTNCDKPFDTEVVEKLLGYYSNND